MEASHRPELRASERFLLFDYFRVPYRVSEAAASPLPGCGALHVDRPDGSTATVLWPLGSNDASERMAAPQRLTLDGVPLWGRAVPNPVANDWLAALPGEWAPSEEVHDAGGRHVASVWADRGGSVLFPFDPGEVMQSLWREDYLDTSRRQGAAGLLLRAYYAARPMLPRGLQIALRRAYTRVQRRSEFPGWPAETALHSLYARVFERISRAAGTDIPYLAPWPDGHSWALVLTHDVETAPGYAALPELLELERSLGYRSSWNFVPGGYPVDQRQVERLLADGFEVGVHGWRHDGRDFASHEVFRARLPQIRRYAEQWGARGFRAPSSLRVWDWMPELGFDYDSSYSDTAPFEPQPGGCCSLLPFFNQDLVELPVTMPQDHTLFVILGERDEALWRTKAEIVRGLDGMALMLTHPDYATPPRLAAYRRLLEEYRGDETAWRALPREVSAWWRERAASRLEPAPEGWRIAGPAAARGRVAFASPGAGAAPRALAS